MAAFAADIELAAVRIVMDKDSFGYLLDSLAACLVVAGIPLDKMDMLAVSVAAGNRVVGVAEVDSTAVVADISRGRRPTICVLIWWLIASR